LQPHKHNIGTSGLPNPNPDFGKGIRPTDARLIESGQRTASESPIARELVDAKALGTSPAEPNANEKRATFFGTSAKTQKVVYVVDASGSLIDTLPDVIKELKRSIARLDEQQEFTVLFAQADEVIEIPAKGKLKRATPSNKDSAVKWIDTGSGNVVPKGTSNPIKALQAALIYRPDMIFLLSNNITGQGRFNLDQKQLLASIARANFGKSKINTFQFLYADPLSERGQKGAMERIAEATGGVYKFIDASELDANK
jgi:hypothetical protein